MALSNIQLQTLFNKAIELPHSMLIENNIKLQRTKEVKNKIHAKGYYFGNESVLNLRNPNTDPFHVYIISPDNESRRDDYSLVIFPFNIKKIFSLVDNLDGVELGYIQLSSNFNAFKIHNRLKFQNYSGVGYSIKVDNEEGVWHLIVEIKKCLMLPSGDPQKLSSIYYHPGLPKTRNENSTRQSIIEFYNQQTYDPITE
ncbi:hypothetical protein VYS60_003544 [Salmonella enterica]|nr:hypothetical protein [Salmonella enterica]